MEHIENHLDANTFVEPVVEPVVQHDAAQIESQILAAFSPMDIDPVFNPTVPDLEPEIWDPYFTVDAFKSLTSPHAWYIMPQVHVYYVWTDNKSNKLFLFMHDKHGVRMAAVVPQDLVEEYKNKNLDNTYVSIHHFQIDYINPTEYPRHNNYSFVRNDVLIVVNNTVGRVIRGDLKKHAGYNTCELFLRDLTIKDTMLGVKQSSTSILNPIHVDLSNEKRKVLSNKDVRTRQTGKKGKTNSAYFEESSAHINIAPNRVPFGTLKNILNTNGARNSLPLQTTSPQNLSGNKENIKPVQTPRSYGSTSLCTNVKCRPSYSKKKRIPQALLPTTKTKETSGSKCQHRTTDTGRTYSISFGLDKGNQHSNTLLPIFDQEYNQTVDGTNVGVDLATQKRKEYQRKYWHQRKLKKVADANANMEPHTMEGMTQNLSDFTRETNIDDRHGSSVLLPMFDQEYNQTTIGTNVGVDPNIQRKKQYDKSRYQQRKEKHRADANNIDDPYDFVYDGLPKEHRALKEQPPCLKCGAKKIQYEFPTFCCMNGKTTLKALEVPPDLYNLFTSQCELGKMFRKNIRAYNTNFSFASMGVKLDKTYNVRSSGVYTFRVNGGIYHRMDQLVPRDGQPRYLQLYFYDPESELEHRLQWPNLDKEIVKILSSVLAPNPYVQTFRTLGNLGPLDRYRVELNASVKVDQRLYNRPTTSEV
ncbi:hypothetical protein CTI12_AA059070 [Artemisia annua]|uniref:Helitron helicase-like domain-containing protein n=1 Tax=Artemisia annua TaxID=35608 RepID=A0A2U1Q9A0_ARTAN|nr:hypothetical protein CTI12_AA059070 [Artemisia annua]